MLLLVASGGSEIDDGVGNDADGGTSGLWCHWHW